MRGPLLSWDRRKLGHSIVIELRDLPDRLRQVFGARQSVGLVGGYRSGHYRLCLYRREYALSGLHSYGTL